MHIAPNTLITTRVLLFDMDGTLVDSTAVVERVWREWAEENGIPFDSFFHKMHGRRAIDTISDIAPDGVDPHEAVKVVDDREMVETDGIVPIPGAAELIASLPKGSWALVTSARPDLARVRMEAAGLPMPEVLVSSKDVAHGKPEPDCFLKALERFGVDAAEAVVFEDAAAGLKAGRAAGCRTIALGTTLSLEVLNQGEWLQDLTHITLEGVDSEGRLQLRVR